MSKKGLEGFDQYYGEIYGERWPALRTALEGPVSFVSRLNRFALFGRERFSGIQEIAGVSYAAHTAEMAPEPDAAGLLDFYKMDLASVFPAIALQLAGANRVLDMCAAPGGKSLILAERLNSLAGGDAAMTGVGMAGELVCNELSDGRRGRLRRVLKEYLPESILEKTKVTAFDASRWCLYETETFDKILLDAPCSGERHLLMDPKEMADWSPARSRNLSQRQYAILASALLVVRPGGQIVYSTCSISPRENDDVIRKLLKKKDDVAFVPLDFPIGEATEFGWMILPDQSGYGPIYISSLIKSE
jgi:16S rRNA C967 or C1407 C5-methylase (RsmB/RsmF family)